MVESFSRANTNDIFFFLLKFIPVSDTVPPDSATVVYDYKKRWAVYAVLFGHFIVVGEEARRIMH